MAAPKKKLDMPNNSLFVFFTLCCNLLPQKKGYENCLLTVVQIYFRLKSATKLNSDLLHNMYMHNMLWKKKHKL